MVGLELSEPHGPGAAALLASFLDRKDAFCPPQVPYMVVRTSDILGMARRAGVY